MSTINVNNVIPVTGTTVNINGITITDGVLSATTYENIPTIEFTGGTVSGDTEFIGGVTANTVFATTYENLPNFDFTGGTVSGATEFISGLTAATISATTYENLPNFDFTGGTVEGFTDFTNGLNAATISATTYENLPITEFTGGTVEGFTDFTNGLLTTTMSATTFYGDGSNLTGITAVANLITVTYSELVNMINESELSSGSFYLISDFRTCYDRPEFYINGEPKLSGETMYIEGIVEPIIVLATSPNTISSTAYQPAYPNDRIQYDCTWDQTEITLGTAYGRITERIDEFNNRTDYDHRNITFNRFQSYDKGIKYTGLINSYDASTGAIFGTDTLFLSEVSDGDILLMDLYGELFGVKVISASTDTDLVVVVDPTFTQTAFNNGDVIFYHSIATENYDEYKEVYVGQKIENDFETFLTFNLTGNAVSNYIGNYSSYMLVDLTNSGFLLSNNVFYSEDIVYSNTIGDRSYNNTITNTFSRNVIDGRFYNNSFKNIEFYRNTIGVQFNNNSFKNGEFYSNIIASGFNSNLIKESEFYSNIIGVDFNSNEINDNFRDNNIGNYFEDNKIYYSFRDNNIGHDFENNEIYSTFYDNKIGHDFDGNTIGDLGNLSNLNFYGNTIGDDFEDNRISGDFEDNKIGNEFNENNINGSFNNNIIGNYFYSNENIGHDFRGNIIGNNFENNYNIGDNFENNQIGEYFRDNNVSYNFRNNKIGNNCYSNTVYGLDKFNWDDLDINNLRSRTYNTFSNALDNRIDEVILGKELIMHDIYNDEYHTVKFTQWTQNNNGGGFSYERRLIYPTQGETVYFTKTNYGSEVDVIYSGSVEITRGENGGIYNVSVEPGWNSNAPANTEWNSIYTQEKNGHDFSYNTIKNNFNYNVIGNDFGFGNAESQGNNIGNNFINNFIGEYFYNNNVADNFNNNYLGDFFQWNTINTKINDNDFRVNYGNITAFTYNSITNLAVDGIYYNIMGTSNGDGSGASFNIEIIGGAVVSIVSGNSIGTLYNLGDTIDILGNQIGGQIGVIDTFTSDAIGKSGITGSYANIFATGTGGEDASFDINVTNGLVDSILLNNGGGYYTVGEELKILGSVFGGVDGIDDCNILVDSIYSDSITITVTEISTKPSVYEQFTKQIFERKGGDKRLSFYDETDTLIITGINE